MRIENQLKSDIGQLKQEQPGKMRESTFSKMVNHSHQKLHQENLSQLLQQIESKGQLLSQKMTLEHVRDYKKLVKQFMEEVVHYGLELREKQGFSQRGRPKIYKLVEEVDQKLIALTDEVGQKEQQATHILAMVGEIKGLLINMYT